MPDTRPIRSLIRPKQASSTPAKTPDPNVQLDNPSQLEIPSFLMNFPFTLATDNPNNAFMAGMSEEELELDHQLAYRQWMDLYQQIAGESLVYVLPCEKDFQDLVYVSNIGAILCHGKKPVAVVSNFKSPPRKGEDKIGEKFFKMMNYEVRRPPQGITWEGNADMKPLRDNIYVGGYGQRTDSKVYDWFEREFDMKVLRLEMTDEHLYHMDCSIGPLTGDTIMACTSLMDKTELAKIEKVCEVISVSSKMAHAAITNFVRVGSFIIFGSTLPGLTSKDKDWDDEHDKINWMEKHLPKLGLDPVAVNISEYEKSGAAVSCMCCPLNFASFAVPIL